MKGCEILINILLNGCKGKMGKSISNYLENSSEFTLMYGIDKDNADLFYEITNKPDVIIDFSIPSATFEALNYAVKELVPIVIATTGFSSEQEKNIIEFSQAIPIFKSSNMSCSINIFSNIVASFSKKLNDMDIEIIEKHHRKKVDAPSGTALMIADKINKKSNIDYNFVFDRCCSTKKSNHLKPFNEIGFSSVRGGSIIGEHTVLFLGESECIELTHTAFSRNIYVEGALKAAKFIITKKNGIYNMDDL